MAYPGAAATAMTAGMTPTMVPGWMRLIWPVFGLMMRNASPARAARSSIHLAVGTRACRRQRALLRHQQQACGLARPVLDDGMRAQLWQRSVALVGLSASSSSAAAPAVTANRA
ncbi:MAG: hypothetical protein HC927_04470 [Deltaproteobacteria bacterium]|nr:hypothetical protein [Deltaproteobacteria bacterium]